MTVSFRDRRVRAAEDQGFDDGYTGTGMQTFESADLNIVYRHGYALGVEAVRLRDQRRKQSDAGRSR